jgi:hypothetical protein
MIRRTDALVIRAKATSIFLGNKMEMRSSKAKSME